MQRETREESKRKIVFIAFPCTHPSWAVNVHRHYRRRPKPRRGATTAIGLLPSAQFETPGDKPVISLVCDHSQPQTSMTFSPPFLAEGCPKGFACPIAWSQASTAVRRTDRPRSTRVPAPSEGPGSLRSLCSYTMERALCYAAHKQRRTHHLPSLGERRSRRGKTSFVKPEDSQRRKRAVSTPKGHPRYRPSFQGNRNTNFRAKQKAEC